jgi:aquaporin Z
MIKKMLSEFIGTFWLVLGGCGSAVLAAAFPQLGIGFAGVAAAFGLTVLTASYALGHLSGAHLNPAVSIGLWAGGRISAKALLPYIASQIAGAIGAAAVLYLIASGKGGPIGSFAANGYAAHSPGKYGLAACLATEVVMTFFFMLVIMGSTDERAPRVLAGLTIGLTLTVIYLVSIPVTNGSVNPARSIGQALFVGGWALEQLWLFIVAPIAGAALAGVVYRFVFGVKKPAAR